MGVRQDFSKRLRVAMARQGYKASATLLEHEFNLRCRPGMVPISTQAAWNWLNGKAIPTHERMLVLADWLKLEPSALLFGDEQQAHGQPDAAGHSVPERLDPLDREFLQAYLALPAVDRKLLQEIMSRFSLAHLQRERRR